MFIRLTDDDEKQVCTPLLKIKAERGKQLETSPLDLNTVERNINAGHYDTVAQFDADVTVVFSTAIREHGRMSVMGSAAIQLKKVRIYIYENSSREV